MLAVLDGTAYTFHAGGGLITYSLSESERTDTRHDSLALGFVTSSMDAVILRVVSGNSNDYLEVQLVGLVYDWLKLVIDW